MIKTIVIVVVVLLAILLIYAAIRPDTMVIINSDLNTVWRAWNNPKDIKVWL